VISGPGRRHQVAVPGRGQLVDDLPSRDNLGRIVGVDEQHVGRVGGEQFKLDARSG
jgi:hypothetical protein